MKKTLLALLAISMITYFSCKKEKAATPTACFTVSGLDSSKVVGLSQTKIDSIIKFRIPDYFITVNEGVATGVYRKMLFFKNCGDKSNYRVLYTGDPSHVYLKDPSNVGAGITGTQTATNFSNDTLSYTFSAAGTYNITLISSNIADNGKDLSRAIISKTIILK